MQFKSSKQLKETDHVNLLKNISKFQLKNYNDDIQYLRIQTFQRNNVTIKNALRALNLIIDLRNNEGGAKKEARKYFSLLKKYSKIGRLYILLNNQSLSQAEIFTLQLKQLKNVTTVGQTTKGMLSYGSNYGKRERLPSGMFEVYLTDMKGRSTLLKYEDHGISPDIPLNNQSDWIEQVVGIIRKK